MTLLERLRYHVTGAIERGEAEAIVEQRALPVRFYLRRLYLNSGGYANGGRHYYGRGAPLWEFGRDDGTGYSNVCRAATREAAKAHVRKLNPGATFWR